METAAAASSSSSVLHGLCCSTTNYHANCNRHQALRARPNNIHLFPSSSSSNFSTHSILRSRHNRFTVFNAIEHEYPSQELAVLMEVEGVLMDAYRLGNRRAFNKAFQKLGLDCANWTEPIYLDLIRKSAGDEERMLILYFDRIGWPTSLPTSEKNTFVKSVLKEKKTALDDLVMSKELPLRPGVEEFIDSACHEGIPVVILTAYSKCGDKVARSVIEKLGEERISRVKVVGPSEVENSLYSQLVKGVPSGTEEQLAKEVTKAVSAERQRIAKEVASMLKLSVEIDTTSSESLDKIVAALRTAAENAGASVFNCVLIAGSQSGVTAAERIGMPCIVVRSSLTTRAEFPSAKAIMEGFGGADLSISKLKGKRLS